MGTMCDNFIISEDNQNEFKMWQGLVGAHYTPYVNSIGNLSWTNNGGLPNPPTVNIAGKGLNIVGIVDEDTDLPETANNFDTYLVGAEDPYSAYIYDNSVWYNLGIIGQGEKGDPGEGVPTGGTVGQVLAKASSADYDTEWVNQSSGVDPATAIPLMDGTAAVGTSSKYARQDHVHPTDSKIVKLQNFEGAIVTPEDYASTGDVDDTNAIQSAINAAGNGGTVVFRPDKTYRISSTIYVDYENVKIISLAATMHKPVITTVNFTDSVVFYVRKTSVQFENLTIEGNYSTTGILIHRSDESVHIDAKILFCYIRHHSVGVQAYGRNCIIKDSNFSGCLTGADFKFMASGEDFARGWIVEGCRFHSMGDHWYSSAEELPSFSGINSVLGFTGGWCVKTPQSVEGEGTKILSTIVRNNHLDGFGYSGLYYGSTECLELSNNIICRDYYNDILCVGIGGGHNYIGVIRDNVVNGRVGSGATPTETIGNVCPIFLTDFAEVNITNNTLMDFSGWGAYIDGAKRTKIVGNVFDGVSYNRTSESIYVSTEQLGGAYKVQGTIFSDNFLNRKAASGNTPNLVNSTSRFLTESCSNNVLRGITDNLAPKFVTETYSATYSITANGATTVSLSDFNVTSKAGYTKASVVKLTSGSTDVLIRGFDITGGGAYFVNVGTAHTGLTAGLILLWMKNN